VQVAATRNAVLLDPHPLWLDAVERVLSRVGVTVDAKATRADQALALVSEHQPDLLVAELSNGNGTLASIDVIRSARERVPELRIIALSSVSDRAQIDSAFAAGVSAYVIKTAQPDDLASAVRQAFEHSVFFAGRALSRPQPAPEDSADPLTKRELEILRLVAEGHTNGQMARMLWVTEQTVKFHLSNIYRKLDVSNRTEASRWAQRRGLLAAEAAAG
jgi:DNA-binding NarL/FixJ family response regulator